MKPTLALLTALLLAPLAALHAADFHVDARRGNDRNPGTESQPFKTISKAAALVQPGDTVRIATGLYRASTAAAASASPAGSAAWQFSIGR